MTWDGVKWIGVPVEELKRCNILEGELSGHFACFTCEFEAASIADTTDTVIYIAACSRYRLWCNGLPVCSGPGKGNKERQYYDEIDLGAYIQEGSNLLAVQVLYQDPEAVVDQSDKYAAIFSVDAPRGGHRLAVAGCGVTTGKADWKVYLDGAYRLLADPVLVNLGAIQEKIDLRQIPFTWKENACVSRNWAAPQIMGEVKPDNIFMHYGILPKVSLEKRDIPYMVEENADFAREVTTTSILAAGKLTVPAGQTVSIVLDAGVHTNAYPIWKFQGGANRCVKITYFEKYTNPGKEIRIDDAKNGEIEGITDEIILPESDHAVCYEPFWYRTFRFVLLTIGEGDTELLIQRPCFRRTGYPLKKITKIQSSEKWVEQVWDICVRTLQNCMMETYMDCPFYEQMQYSMDTRLQALFTYIVSADPLLAKKALRDFHDSRISCGLVQGKAPTVFPQVISTFSLYYIYMIADYYDQTGDLELLKKYRSDVDAILEYYDTKIGEDGLVGHPGYWAFVDWLKEWDSCYGEPRALSEGASSIINLMYGYALLRGADICEATGRTAVAEEYRQRQRQITARVQSLCWNPDREMYREGPSCDEFTQHAQSWAVLNRMVTGESARNLMMRCTADANVMKCTFSTCYEYFRAAQLSGCYEITWSALSQWIELPGKGCTTCPETPQDSRSECHAWSALPIYELIRSIAGIRQESGDWKHVVIEPNLYCLPDLSGCAATPKGEIIFDFRKQDSHWRYCVTLPENMTGTLVSMSGEKKALKPGVNIVE